MEKNVCKMTDDSIFLIDIEKILKTKAGKKYKYIPRFVVSYLKHIVHQDELNVFLKDSKNKVGVDFLEACMEFLDAKVEIKGLENLPENGKCTFVSNHPLGGQDGVALGYILGKHYNGNVRYLVNDLLMNLHGLAPLCIPISAASRVPSHSSGPRRTDGTMPFIRIWPGQDRKSTRLNSSH